MTAVLWIIAAIATGCVTFASWLITYGSWIEPRSIPEPDLSLGEWAR
jgi:hypothetical protein